MLKRNPVVVIGVDRGGGGRDNIALRQGHPPAWYAGTRTGAEARATLEQAEELRRALEQLGERLGD
jgi:hypothetical protein